MWYFSAPDWILSYRMNAISKFVLLRALNLSRKDPTTPRFLTNESLAMMFGVSKRTIVNAFKELKAEGFITLCRNPNNPFDNSRFFILTEKALRGDDDTQPIDFSQSENIALSPFTLLYEKAGFAFAASLMNAVILSAILSAGNSGMYSSTRMLFDMAKEGRAPKWFSKLDTRGVPMNALYATTAVAALCFLTTFIGEQQVFNWLLNMSGMCGFIVWLGIAISHYRFRKGYLAQGHKLEDLAYRAKFFPFAPWFAFILCSIIILGQNYQALIGGKIDWLGLLSTYISIPLFLAIWLGYKWKHKTKLIAYKEMNVKEGE